ncbi:MAG: alpha/beta fold hydrolase [Proteobacteria bacterium]|nr:MAG: alpha/beta fold hydrolase [Pseudomonadota bacterium]
MVNKKIMSVEWQIEVALNHDQPDGRMIEIFAREIWTAGNKTKDIVVFLQGGPGFPAPRAGDGPPWITEVLKDFRVLLVDHRGTGRSSPIGPDTARAYSQPEDLAEYFSHFRADSAVKDTELLRKEILKTKPWILLGQSYGGFMAFTYLSLFPASLKGVMTTGGCPPITANNPSEVYERLFAVMVKRNQEFYKKYPEDLKTVQKIVDLLNHAPILLPDGGILSSARLLDIGLAYLGGTSGMERLHDLLDMAFADRAKTKLSYAFIHNIAQTMGYETHPIYAVIHEALYCSGTASNWAADRLLKSRPEFSSTAEMPLFLGENIRQAMFDEYALLRPYREAAELLAAKTDWPALYDLNQLSKNEVPVECFVYKTDYYVDFAFSKDAVKRTKNATIHIHDSWQHDSIRTHSKDVMKILLSSLKKRMKIQEKKKKK